MSEIPEKIFVKFFGSHEGLRTHVILEDSKSMFFGSYIEYVRAPQWVSVEDWKKTGNTPDYYWVSWLYDGTREQGEAYWDGESWLFPDYGEGKDGAHNLPHEYPTITHVMPLPAPPEGSDE